MAVFKSVAFRVVSIGPELRQKRFATRTAAEAYYRTMDAKYPNWEIRLEKVTTKLEGLRPRAR